ncbi:molybdate ABC transporter substrate-binding protein [Nitratireductor luteus]|uniref:molybdate ABC transporter substrate-binding protein n=1 Tax=Nitratireductor luteus TaxID=2976980 RepID=UPI00223FFFC1|nr:molybdate ABC transporter substrate-binding protein [Nitratireductor luteus]
MRKLLAVVLATSFVLATASASLAADKIVVFAAASMKEAIDAAVEAFGRTIDAEVIVSFASSSVLARQIEAGAPADIFISANQDWMNRLEGAGLLRGPSRRDIAGNDLVIAAAGPMPKIADPRVLLGRGRFAMGDPGHVPAGMYAKAALESLGLWERLRDGAVFAENVRVALEFARRGEVTAAIVYGSDQKATSDDLVRVYTFPGDSHPPIVYPAAATRKGTAAAENFLDFLSGAEGRAIFARYGFAPVPEDRRQ